MTRQRPEPTPEELAAIVAAVEVTWPRPAVLLEAPRRPPAWRFSGRWWAPRSPAAAARRRP